MVDTGRCSICGEFKFKFRSLGGEHKCPPAWWCWISDPEWGMERDDGKAIYNVHPDDAAAEYIANWDSGDYTCIGGEEMQVSVAPVGNLDDVTVFTVRGEMVPEYWAEEVRQC